MSRLRVNDRSFMRGIFLVAIALFFGLWSFHYPIGDFRRAGAGLFPLMVSSILGLIGVVTIVRAAFVAHEAIEFNVRNVSVVLGSLVGFALLSEHVNMTLGIIFLVFFSTIAGTSYSVARNVKISVGLLAIAFAMSKLLGVNLPLY